MNKNEKFINKAKEIHKNKFDYSLVNYVTNKIKVSIICPVHGVFEQTPYNHYVYGCKSCAYQSREVSFETFSEKANKVHENKYNYIEESFKGVSKPLKIICSVHGEFEQQGSRHLLGKGCLKCANEGKKITTESFTNKAKEIHNSYYDYSLTNITDYKTKIKIICPVHGEFEQTIPQHLQGHGCIECGKQKNKEKKYTTNDFITESKKLFDNYTYEKTEYVNYDKPLIVTCPAHGDFTKRYYEHIIVKQGCPKCSLEVKPSWTREEYISRTKDRNCIFYILECSSDDEHFYKFGITSLSVDKRYRSKTYMPYNFKILKEINGSSEFIWDLENAIKRKISSTERYKPKIHFAGWTECVTTVESLNQLIGEIENE